VTTTAQRITDLVAPIAEELGTGVYDVEHAGGAVRIWLQRSDGLDLALITEATRRISAALDAMDLLPGPYTLEVSSPGLERTLRTPAHFAGAVGEQVKLKLRAGLEGDRRIEGELLAATGDSVTVRTSDGDERTVAITELDRARTHIDWAPTPKPGGGGKKKGRSDAGSGGARSPKTPGSKTPGSTGPRTGDTHSENEAIS
jgi:ribosome maturation factor RimP